MLYFDLLATMFFIPGGLSRIQYGKSKLLVFKIARNWRGFPLQARYLVRKIAHVVLIVLYISHWFWTSDLVSHFD